MECSPTSGSKLRGKALPERIRISVFDDPSGSVPLSLQSRRMWPVGIGFAVMFAIFAGVALGQITSMASQEIDSVFSLMFVMFQGFWVLGWSVGVLVLFLLTVLFLFYGETARLVDRRLVHIPRLGPLKIFIEYDLAKVRNLRAAKGGGPDRVRIRFNYGKGDRSLGNDMPIAVAEARIETIQSAIAALGGNDGTPPAELTPRREPPGFDPTRLLKRFGGVPGASSPRTPPRVRRRETESEPLAWTSTSVLALLAANFVPLGGVLLLGWDLGAVMTLFWAENGVIGFYNLLKLGVVSKWGIVFVGPFFVGHYGAFMAGHFLFIYYMFVRGIESSATEGPVLESLGDLFVPLWPALLALTVSHGISFYENFLKGKEHVGRKVGELMGEPYKRIVILHVTIIFGGWLILLLGSPLPALVLFLVLKTATDQAAHRKEHAGQPIG